MLCLGNVNFFLIKKDSCFLTIVFKHLMKKMPACILLLVGDREDREKIKMKIK